MCLLIGRTPRLGVTPLSPFWDAQGQAPPHLGAEGHVSPEGCVTKRQGNGIYFILFFSLWERQQFGGGRSSHEKLR